MVIPSGGSQCMRSSRALQLCFFWPGNLHIAPWPKFFCLCKPPDTFPPLKQEGWIRGAKSLCIVRLFAFLLQQKGYGLWGFEQATKSGFNWKDSAFHFSTLARQGKDFKSWPCFLREWHDVHCILHKLDASQHDGDDNTLILEAALAALAKYKVINFLNCALLFWLFPMLPPSSLVSFQLFFCRTLERAWRPVMTAHSEYWPWQNVSQHLFSVMGNLMLFRKN